ncbi:MAG: helix-hairpin-helix domain-containing protein [Myxococcota bacterium]
MGALVTLGHAEPLQAQVVTTQRYEFLGWTSTGNETLRRVVAGASGISADGDPVNWSYTVLEIGATSGGSVSRFRVGVPKGQAQSYWQTAKPEDEGLKRIKAMGMREGISSPVSPDGSMALVTLISNQPGEPTTTADCRGCTACRSTITVLLYDRQRRNVTQLSQQSHTGAPNLPGSAQATCPTLAAQSWWHPEGNRLAIVYDNVNRSSGEQSQRLDHYTFPDALPTLTYTPLPTSRPTGAQHRKQVTIAKELIAKLPEGDPALAYRWVSLGDLHRSAGELEEARQAYATALKQDRRMAKAQLGLAMVLAAEGQTRDALRMVRKVERADRREGRLAADIGLFYLATGDLDKAQNQLQRAVGDDMESGVGFEGRLTLGFRILELDLNAGLAYLDNLLSASPSILSANTGGGPKGVDLNTANQAQLESLPGINTALAQTILADRELNGPFKAPNDLMRVSGIDARFYQAQCHRLRVQGVAGCKAPLDAKTKRLRDAYVQLIEEAIHADDQEIVGRYLKRLDPASEQARQLALRASARQPGRARTVLDKTAVLLDTKPTQCGLLLARGVAHMTLKRPASAFGNLVAATLCDANLPEAHIHLGELYSRRNALKDAARHYTAYQRLVQPRRGDPLRTNRLERVEHVLPRLSHNGVVLLDHTCTTSGSALRCEGVVLNTSTRASGPVAITLNATDRRKRSAGESEAALPNIAAGASLDFKIALSNPQEDHTVVLSVGRNPSEIELNRTLIR